MDFGQSITICFSKYAKFDGRAQRSEFWWFYLFTWMLGLGATIMDSMTGTGEVFYWITAIATAVPTLAAAARRLHDVNKSGWWQLISLTIIGIIPLLIWTVSEGSKKKNQYGNPIKIKK